MATSCNNIAHLPGGWVIESLSSFEPNSNPFRQDRLSMGTSLANGLTMMYLNHATEDAKPFYLVDAQTGSRIKIYPPGTFTPQEVPSFMSDFESKCADGMTLEDATLAAQLKQALRRSAQ